MSKLTIARIAEILKRNHMEPATLRRVLEELTLAEAAAKPEAAGGEPVKRAKSQFVILSPKGDGDRIGWVLQIDEDAAPHTVIERIHRAAYDYNASKKGRLYPVRTMGEAIESVPAKYFKPEGSKTAVKTKTPVLIIVTDNALPAA